MIPSKPWDNETKAMRIKTSTAQTWEIKGSNKSPVKVKEFSFMSFRFHSCTHLDTSSQSNTKIIKKNLKYEVLQISILSVSWWCLEFLFEGFANVTVSYSNTRHQNFLSSIPFLISEFLRLHFKHDLKEVSDVSEKLDSEKGKTDIIT